MYTSADEAVVDLLVAFSDRLMVEDDLWHHVLAKYPIAQRNRYKAMYRGKEGRARAILGYPRSDSIFPCWAVTLASEEGSKDFLADHIGYTEGPDALEIIGVPTDQVIQILIYAPNPDVCRVHSLLVKAAMLGARDWFQDTAGFDAVSYGGMRDLAPDPRYLPEELWGRVQTWQFADVTTTAISLPTDWIEGPVKVGIVGETLDDDGTEGFVEPEELQ